MPKYSENKILNYTPSQINALVLDIERYTEFLPWCGAARIIEKNDNYLIADLVIQYKAFSERYRSRVEHKQVGNDFFIDVSMVDGPFQYLNNSWKLYHQPPSLDQYNTNQPDNHLTISPAKVQIEFFIDFKFRSVILDKIIGLVFDQAAKKMVNAFESRAQQIYQ